MKLLSLSNPKTAKGAAAGWLTAILHLAPFNLSGRNVCPFASEGCAMACLNTAGRGRFQNIQDARIRKTRWFFEDRAGFIEQLHKDIGALVRKCAREDKKPAVRLNGTSDIVWERTAPEIFERWPDVQFYDYTKHPERYTLPGNYHLTYSRSEGTGPEMIPSQLAHGRNVAVVFDAPVQPGTYYMGAPVINGDETDLRFLDAPGSIVGLYAKGDAKKDTSGFVVSVGGCS